MARYGEPPRNNRRSLFIGIGSGLAGLCVLCSGIGFFASKDDKGEDRDRPAVPAAATTAAATTAVATTTVGVVTTTAAAPPPPATEAPPAGNDDQDVYYKNCTEARRAGAAPLYRGEPGYRPALDRDGDGVACES